MISGGTSGVGPTDAGVPPSFSVGMGGHIGIPTVRGWLADRYERREDEKDGKCGDQRHVIPQMAEAPTWGHHWRRTIACPVSGSNRPVSSTHPVH